MLKIEERNYHSIQDLIISQEELDVFIKKHKNLNFISENDRNMIDSYIMIDPQGRIYQNRGNSYKFS